MGHRSARRQGKCAFCTYRYWIHVAAITHTWKLFNYSRRFFVKVYTQPFFCWFNAGMVQASPHLNAFFFNFLREKCEVAHFLSHTAIGDIMLIWRFRLPLKCNPPPCSKLFLVNLSLTGKSHRPTSPWNIWNDQYSCLNLPQSSTSRSKLTRL